LSPVFYRHAEEGPGDPVTPKEAVAFVARHGVVLQAARGPVPSLAEAVVGSPIRGSWWGHAKGKEIFRAAAAISGSPDVLVCKLIAGKVTYVHRRLWPALVKLAGRLRKAQLAREWEERTPSGAHRSRQVAFPAWVPSEVMKEAAGLSISEAESILSQWPALIGAASAKGRASRRTNERSDQGDVEQ